MPERDSSRPPTLNFLGPFQRSRLLKSSRKIEYLLGTTPHVLESSDFPLHWSSCDRVDGHAPDGKHHHHRLKAKNHRPNRLHLSPLTHEYPRALGTHTSDLPSPFPLTVSTPAWLRSLTEPPEGTATSPDRLHRRQMAKLTRVLGENIPPELVRVQNARKVQSEPPPDSLRQGDSGMTSRHPRRTGRRRSSSYSPSSNHQRHPVSPSTSAPPPPRHNLPLATSPSPPPPPVPPRSPQRSHAAKGKERRPPRGLSPIAPTLARSLSSPTSLQRSNRSSSGSGRSPPQSITHPLLTSDQRVEARWDGEWNVKDTEERAMALRNLKSR